MRATVSLRGSRSPRRVDRDASPQPGKPGAFASLSVIPDVEPIRYSLTYHEMPGGGIEVELARYAYPGALRRVVFFDRIGVPS